MIFFPQSFFLFSVFSHVFTVLVKKFKLGILDILTVFVMCVCVQLTHYFRIYKTQFSIKGTGKCGQGDSG
jgi:phosphoglycerol transferase MdoB-like AlkP superfamily enzyme